MTVVLAYRQPLAHEIKGLPPKVFVFFKVSLGIALELIPVLQRKNSINRQSTYDVHLIRWNKFAPAMENLAPAHHIFWPIEPADTDVYVLRVECTRFQDLRFPVSETASRQIIRIIVLDQDEITGCDATSSDYCDR